MPTHDPHHAVYAGSFDPVTLGHLDIVRRGANVFDRLTVGIGINPDKRPLFSPDERQSLMQRVFDGLDNVEVRCFEGLTVDFVRECGAGVMLRGIRTLTDIESEFTMALANRRCRPTSKRSFSWPVKASPTSPARSSNRSPRWGANRPAGSSPNSSPNL